MTPLEFQREVAAYALARQDEFERDVAHAWQVAAFCAEAVWSGRLPSLKAVLGRAKPQEQTPADLAAQLGVLSKQYGLPVLPMSDATKSALKPMVAHG